MKSRLSGYLVSSALLVPAGLTMSCGEQPAFNETQTSRHSTNATAGQDQSDNGDQDKENGITTKAEGEKDSGGSANDSGSGGSIKIVGNGGEEGAGTSTGNGNGTDSGGNNGEEILEEDGGTLVIPGVKVQRVGLNFEDAADFDFNDAVMCFEGLFKIEGTDVVSYKQQTVVAKTFSASGCDHRVDVRILHDDGTTEMFSYRSDSGESLSLPFRIKSKLDVTVTTIQGGCDATPVSMHNAQYALVKANVCNDSGT